MPWRRKAWWKKRDGSGDPRWLWLIAVLAGFGCLAIWWPDIHAIFFGPDAGTFIEEMFR